MSDAISTAPPYQVDFEPVGKRVEVAPDTTLLEAAQQAGLALASACGGMGKCGQCQVVILVGRVSSPTVDEENILTELEPRSCPYSPTATVAMSASYWPAVPASSPNAIARSAGAMERYGLMAPPRP